LIDWREIAKSDDHETQAQAIEVLEQPLRDLKMT
jgi:hypothetical protein